MHDLEMEMQFAYPDWQPGSSLRQQALAGQVEITCTPDPSLPTDEPPATCLWTPGQTAQLPVRSTGADAKSGIGQRQHTSQKQSPAPVPLKSRRQRWLFGLLTRVAMVVIWFTTPLVTRAFHGGWIVPLLGVFFLPATALTYTVVSALAGSVSGLGWLWIVGALLLDLASHAGQTSKPNPGLPKHTSPDDTPSTSEL